MIKTVVAGLLLSIGSCAPRAAVPPPDERASQASAMTAPAITLERVACFGGCPVYTISVSRSGEVSYEGEAHVRQLGAATGQVPKARVDSLLFELDRAGYFSFADLYTSGTSACGRYVTDLPSVTTSVTLRGKTKRIVHDYGCGGAPGALVVLERRIDEVLDSGRWTGR